MTTVVVFSSNDAGKQGGAMYSQEGNLTLTNVTYIHNSAQWGGAGLATYTEGQTVSLNQVAFIENDAPSGGGGMYLYSRGTMYEDPPATLQNTLFEGNTGSGLHVYDSRASLTNVTFSGNDGYFGGGGLNNQTSDTVLTNVTFSGNTGGAVVQYRGSTIFNHVTMNGNSTTDGRSGALYLSLSAATDTIIRNSILWGNGTEPILVENSPVTTLSVVRSIVEGGYPGTANLNKDPHLGKLGDYGGKTPTLPLLPGSAAIDQISVPDCVGIDGQPLLLDQRGMARPQGSQCDMGAYEAFPFEAFFLPLIFR